MSRSSSSRARKQNFSPSGSSHFLAYSEEIDSDNESQLFNDDDSPPRRANRISCGARKVSDPRDRQSQLDHNEQERGRRRELAIIYELIRTCITDEDIRRHLDGTAKSADKLSYPQLLQISCGKIRDELHDQKLLRILFRDIEALESICDELGLEIEKKRPAIEPIDRHKIIAEVVDDVLKVDKRARGFNGDYVMTQRSRALSAHKKLSELLTDVNKLVNINQVQNYHAPFLPQQENRTVGPIRRTLRRNQRRRRPVIRRIVPEEEVSNFSPSQPIPHSSNDESNLTPNIIEEVIEQFPFPSLPPPDSEEINSMITSSNLSENGDRLIGDMAMRNEDYLTNDEALNLLQSFDVNGIDEVGLDSLFGLVSNENFVDDITFDPFSYPM